MVFSTLFSWRRAQTSPSFHFSSPLPVFFCLMGCVWGPWALWGGYSHHQDNHVFEEVYDLLEPLLAYQGLLQPLELFNCASSLWRLTPLTVQYTLLYVSSFSMISFSSCPVSTENPRLFLLGIILPALSAFVPHWPESSWRSCDPHRIPQATMSSLTFRLLLMVWISSQAARDPAITIAKHNITGLLLEARLLNLDLPHLACPP